MYQYIMCLLDRAFCFCLMLYRKHVIINFERKLLNIQLI